MRKHNGLVAVLGPLLLMSQLGALRAEALELKFVKRQLSNARAALRSAAEVVRVIDRSRDAYSLQPVKDHVADHAPMPALMRRHVRQLAKGKMPLPLKVHLATRFVPLFHPADGLDFITATPVAGFGIGGCLLLGPVGAAAALLPMETWAWFGRRAIRRGKREEQADRGYPVQIEALDILSKRNDRGTIEAVANAKRTPDAVVKHAQKLLAGR